MSDVRQPRTAYCSAVAWMRYPGVDPVLYGPICMSPPGGGTIACRIRGAAALPDIVFFAGDLPRIDPFRDHLRDIAIMREVHRHRPGSTSYRARIVDGLGSVVPERVFAVETASDGQPRRCEPGMLGDLTPARTPDVPPEIARQSEPLAWLQEHVLAPFLKETRAERLAEVGRVVNHVALSLKELVQRADDEIGRVNADVERGGQGAEGRLAMAEAQHAELLARRERRREELQQQQALSLQGVERITSVLVLPHPNRAAVEVRRHQPDPATEATAMRVVMEHEREQGHHVEDVSAKNLGYDVTSLDPKSGDLRLIEVKGLAAARGHNPADTQRAAGRRGPARLLLVVRRHRLQAGTSSPGTDSRPSAVPVARGHQGAALLHGRRRDDGSDAGTRLESKAEGTGTGTGQGLPWNTK